MPLLFIFHTSFNCRLTLFIYLVCECECVCAFFFVLTHLLALCCFFYGLYTQNHLFPLNFVHRSAFFHHLVWNPVRFPFVWVFARFVLFLFSLVFLFGVCVCVMHDWYESEYAWKIFTSKGFIKIICVRGYATAFVGTFFAVYFCLFFAHCCCIDDSAFHQTTMRYIILSIHSMSF